MNRCRCPDGYAPCPGRLTQEDLLCDECRESNCSPVLPLSGSPLDLTYVIEDAL